MACISSLVFLFVSWSITCTQSTRWFSLDTWSITAHLFGQFTYWCQSYRTPQSFFFFTGECNASMQLHVSLSVTLIFCIYNNNNNNYNNNNKCRNHFNRQLFETKNQNNTWWVTLFKHLSNSVLCTVLLRQQIKHLHVPITSAATINRCRK